MEKTSRERKRERDWNREKSTSVCTQALLSFLVSKETWGVPWEKVKWWERWWERVGGSETWRGREGYELFPTLTHQSSQISLFFLTVPERGRVILCCREESSLALVLSFFGGEMLCSVSLSVQLETEGWGLLFHYWWGKSCPHAPAAHTHTADYGEKSSPVRDLTDMICFFTKEWCFIIIQQICCSSTSKNSTQLITTWN